MFLLVKEYTNKYLSFAAAFLYIYTPYRSTDLYVRGAIGEIISFVFLPLILLSFVKIFKSKDLKWIGIGAISLASLVLSHNITAYMFFPFLSVFVLMQLLFTHSKKVFFSKVIFTVILALLISIYFWLPAIVDSSLFKYDTVFNFVDHFPTLKQLVTPFWGYGASVAGPYDGMSFFIGVVNLIVILLGSFILISKWKKINKDQKIILSWGFFSFFIAVFLMNYRSSFVWSHAPLLPYFQFPWRFLILTTFVTPLFFISLDVLPKNKFMALFLVALTLTTTAYMFRPHDFLGRQDDYFLNRYIPSPVASEEYKKTQEEYLRLPKYTLIRPDKTYPRITDDNNIKDIILENDLDASFLVESTSSARINYNKYYFPGWLVKIDGREAQPVIGSPFGQINIDVPSGSHRVEVRFGETPLKIILDAISLIAFLVSLMLAKLWIPRRLYGLF
jgi:hypothetical protein